MPAPSRKPTTPRRSTTDKGKEEVQLFTRIPAGLRTWLKDEVTKLEGEVTEKDAISNILNYLKGTNNPALVRSVLLGKASPDVAKLGTQYSKALQRIGYGEHAFARKFYSWAYEEFSRVPETAGSDDADLIMFAHFKAAYCLLEISYGIRHEALDKLNKQAIKPDEWVRYYTDADHCVSLALWRYKKVRDLGGDHPVCVYNSACAWSLKGMLTAEREMGPDNKLMMLLAPVHRSRNADDNNWKTIGPQWRNNIKKTAENSQMLAEVRSYTDKCFVHLKKLTDYDHDAGEAKPLYDIVFLYELARDDSDLDFVRHDEATSRKFRDLMGDFDASRLNSFGKIKERLPVALQTKADLEALLD